MATLLQTNVSGSLLKPNLLQGGQPIDQLVRLTPFYSFLERKGLIIPSNGSDPFQFNVRTAAGTAAVFNEGDTISTYYSDTYKRASVDAFYVREPIAQSGRLRDANLNKGAYVDLMATEIQSAVVNVRKQVEKELLGSTAGRGISSLVDSSAAYAGMDPSTVTSWASLVTNVSGALTVAVLENMHASLRGATYGATPDFILATPNQTTNYVRTIGPGASSGGVFRVNMGSGPFDAGVLKEAPQFAGMEWVEVLDMTNTELVMGDSAHIKLVIHRDFDVLPLAQTTDDNMLQVSWAGGLIIDRRKSFGRLTGVTA